MEPIKIAEQIQQKIDLLEGMRLEIKKRATKKAESKALYEKQVALTMIKLRNGVKMTLEGSEIENPPATNIEKISRGICWEECLTSDEAEGMYKSLIVNIECVKAELNGLQSINRHLEDKI